MIKTKHTYLQIFLSLHSELCITNPVEYYLCKYIGKVEWGILCVHPLQMDIRQRYINPTVSQYSETLPLVRRLTTYNRWPYQCMFSHIQTPYKIYGILLAYIEYAINSKT